MNAPLAGVLAERIALAHRFGLERVRRGLRFAIAHRDRDLPRLAEVREELAERDAMVPESAVLEGLSGDSALPQNIDKPS